jgi:Tfp pilus assembly protein PilF
MEQALRPGTRDALLFFHAGMIANRLGQTSQAKERLQTALNINPGFHILYAGVARQQLKALDNQAALTASQGQIHVP